jgi:tetratricopeptide (TPR) repeat protein
MKITMKLWVLFFGVLMLGSVAYAQSPREELQQMVEQLQKTPTDTVLREKIIVLATSIKPAPAIPEEAERRMARGAAAFKGAKSAANYQDAAKEFEQATLVAPWYGDAYYNLGVAQDKAGNYEAALRSLNLARLASPDSKDIKALIYEVDYRREKLDDLSARLDEPFRTEMQGFPAGNRWFCFANYEKQKQSGWRARDEIWIVYDGTTAQSVLVGWTEAKALHGIYATPLNTVPNVSRQFWEATIYTHNVYTISADGQLVNVVRRKGLSPAEAYGEEMSRWSCSLK